MPSSVSRKALALITGSVLAIGMAGCTANSGETETSGSADEINVYLAQHPWTSSIEEFLPEFEKETGIKVNLTTLGDQQLSQQYSVKFNAGASDVDVMMVLWTQDGRQFQQNGWFHDITSDVAGDSSWNWDDFSEVSRNSVSNDDGQVFGVPLISERAVLYYRKDLLSQAGLEVPTTFDELEKAAKALTDKSAEQYGFVARGAGNTAVATSSSYVYGYGGDWSKDGVAMVSDPKTVDALSFFGGLLADYGPPGALNMGWPEATAVFQQGKAAMSTEVDALFANYIDPEASRVVDQVGFAPFPKGPGGHYVSNVVPWALSVAESSTKKDEAGQFLKWATSEDMSKKMLAKNNPVTRDSAWADPKASAGYPPELAQIISEPGDITYVDHTSPRGVIAVGKARDAIGTVISTAIDGGDVQAAADVANQQLQDILDSEKK